MKTTNKIAFSVMMMAAFAVNAQNGGGNKQNNNQGNNHQQQTNQQQGNSTNQNSNQNGNQSGNQQQGTTKPTVTVQSQPQKPVNQVGKQDVNYKKNDPKAVTTRNGQGGNMATIHYGNNDYYHENGVFYTRYNNNYVRTAPPAGLNISILPTGYISIFINNLYYYYFEGTYYQQASSGYQVVVPPIGTIVYALPAEYEKVQVNGSVYYEYNGVLYDRISYNGDRAYQVVGYVN